MVILLAAASAKVRGLATFQQVLAGMKEAGYLLARARWLDDAASILLPLVRDKTVDTKAREQAAEVLGKLGGREALIEALRDKDSDVRQAAAKALGKLGDRQAIPALMEVLSTTTALPRFGGQR